MINLLNAGLPGKSVVIKILAVVVMGFLVANGCTPQPPDYDIALMNGRVMDPESGLDALRHVGISDGSVAAVSSDPIKGRITVDVTGLVVAPGFIDLHAHGQDSISNRLQVADGVTTALELELGVYPVAAWLAQREGKSRINYGVTAGHYGARVKLMTGSDIGHLPTLSSEESARIDQTDAKYREATSAQIDELIALLAAGIDEGGLGIGLGIIYTPGASRLEILKLFELAVKKEVPVFVHLRIPGDADPDARLAGFQEVISNAASTGASVHIVHMNSSADESAKVTLAMIRGARARGLDVTTESYPYTAGSTLIESALFDSWQGLTDEAYQKLQWAETGEHLTSETFRKYRRQGGWVIIHGRSEDTNAWIVAQPDVMTASDGIPFLYGPAHPRGAGTFSRILGHYVREGKVLSLMDALRKMTLLPAQRLEGMTSQMKKKGRVQVGADADLTVFNPNTVIDRSTYTQGDVPSEGIIHVLVSGTFVVRDAKLVDGVFPGRAIRRNQQR
jgi:dihydroorotase